MNSQPFSSLTFLFEAFYQTLSCSEFQQKQNLIQAFVICSKFLYDSVQSETYRFRRYIRYHEMFSNKYYMWEYYVTQEAKTSLKINFIIEFEKHNIQRFIGISKKFNINHVTTFYSNMKSTRVGLDFHFRGRLIKFTRAIFYQYLGIIRKQMCGNRSLKSHC